MIGSFASAAIALLVVTNGTKYHISCLKSYKAQIWNLS